MSSATVNKLRLWEGGHHWPHQTMVTASPSNSSSATTAPVSRSGQSDTSTRCPPPPGGRGAGTDGSQKEEPCRQEPFSATMRELALPKKNTINQKATVDQRLYVCCPHSPPPFSNLPNALKTIHSSTFRHCSSCTVSRGWGFPCASTTLRTLTGRQLNAVAGPQVSEGGGKMPKQQMS